jgi:hypothetical protein
MSEKVLLTPTIPDPDDIAATPGGSYAGIPIGTADYKGQPVNVLRLTHAARAKAARTTYCVEGHSHWNPASFFRDHAIDLGDEARLFRAAAAIAEKFDAEASS